LSPAEIILAAVCAFGAGYTLASTFLVRRWLGSGRDIPQATTREPTTFFRPIKSGVADNETRLRQLLASCGRDDQILLGTGNVGDTGLCRRIAAEWPELDVTTIECRPGLHANPKINKLAQMEPIARHARWICSDSELAPSPGFFDRFRAEWEVSGADGISAPYRFAGGHWIDRADAISCALTLWPGAAVLRAFGKIDFLTGACFGVRADALRRCGGFATFGDYLAEDNRIGKTLVAYGGKIALAATPVCLGSDGLDLRGWLLHQHRVARTYFVCNPAGYIGLPLTFGLPTALAGVVLGNSPAAWLAGATGLWLLRTCSTASIECGMGATLSQAWNPLGVLAASLVEASAWVAGLLPLPVWWGGRWRRVGRAGRLDQPSG